MASKRQLKLKLNRADRTKLGKMWDAGIASGSAGELDMKKLRREAREARLIAERVISGLPVSRSALPSESSYLSKPTKI